MRRMEMVSGPQVVVAGKFRGAPWSKHVLHDLLQLHDHLASNHLVVSDNWMTSFLENLQNGSEESTPDADDADYPSVDAADDDETLLDSLLRKLTQLRQSTNNNETNFPSVESLSAFLRVIDEEETTEPNDDDHEFGGKYPKLEILRRSHGYYGGERIDYGAEFVPFSPTIKVVAHDDHDYGDDVTMTHSVDLFSSVESRSEVELRSAWERFRNSSEFRCCNLAAAGNDTYYFRWFYQTHHVELAGAKRRVAAALSTLQHHTGSDVEVYADAPELDWWRTIGVARFSRPLVAVFVVTAAWFLIQAIFGQLARVTLWCGMTSASVTVGVAGATSLLDRDLNIFVFPVLLLSFPLASQLCYHMVHIFVEGSSGGRAKWSKAALRRSAPVLLISLFSLVAASDTALGFDQSHAFLHARKAVRVTALVVAGHCLLVLPVALTVAPPSKKLKPNCPAPHGASPARSVSACGRWYLGSSHKRWQHGGIPGTHSNDVVVHDVNL